MGIDINVHDQWAVESMGAIQDRTKEHLGQSDKAIVQYRRLLRPEIEKVAAGESPMLCLDDAHARSIQGPATMDGIGPTLGWETFWMEVDVKRRRGAPWSVPVPAEIAGQGAASDGGGVMGLPLVHTYRHCEAQRRSNPEFSAETLWIASLRSAMTG